MIQKQQGRDTIPYIAESIRLFYSRISYLAHFASMILLDMRPQAVFRDYAEGITRSAIYAFIRGETDVFSTNVRFKALDSQKSLAANAALDFTSRLSSHFNPWC